MWQQGPKWRLFLGVDDPEMPAAVPERLDRSKAPGGVVLQFFNENGDLLAQSDRPADLFGAPVDLVGVREALEEAQDVIVVAFDGDTGERVASIEID